MTDDALDLSDGLRRPCVKHASPQLAPATRLWGPNFLGDTNVIAAITLTGDAVCRATNVDYRLDTASAPAFLAAYVELP